MAATPLSRSCPIRIISVHLLVAPGFREAVAAGQLLRVLFLDREGHISAQPHYVPREQALILAANHCGCSVPKAWCGCSELPGQDALRLRLSVVATPPVGLGFLEQWITSHPGERVDALDPSPKRLTAAD